MTTIYDILTDSPRVEAVEGMLFDDYRQSPGMNPSSIWAGRKSMKHMFDYFLLDRKDSKAMRVGRAVHSCILEPELFEDAYAAYDGKSRAGKGFKKAAATSTREVLLKDEYDSILTAADAVARDPVIAPYVSEGSAEVVVFAGERGMQCKGRIDWVSISQNAIVDIKTTKNIDAEPFGRDVRQFGYYLKLAMYRRWFEAATGKRLPVFIIAVENARPYDVALVPMPDADLDVGERQAVTILKRVGESLVSREWPGVANGQPYPLHTPTYWMPEDDEIIGAEDA